MTTASCFPGWTFDGILEAAKKTEGHCCPCRMMALRGSRLGDWKLWLRGQEDDAARKAEDVTLFSPRRMDTQLSPPLCLRLLSGHGCKTARQFLVVSGTSLIQPLEAEDIMDS